MGAANGRGGSRNPCRCVRRRKRVKSARRVPPGTPPKRTCAAGSERMESSVRARTREGACIAATLSAAAIVLRRDGQPYCPHATVLAPLGCAALGVAADDDADTVGATSMDVIYCAGAAGMACWARNHLGDVRELPMTRWFGASGTAAADRLADDAVVAECSGRPTLDMGCGPGRFTASLQRSGSAALGVDASAVAVGLTRQRGGTAMRRDLLARCRPKAAGIMSCSLTATSASAVTPYVHCTGRPS